jgi:hypothetical protein
VGYPRKRAAEVKLLPAGKWPWRKIVQFIFGRAEIHAKSWES